jgi:mono/diheme cytochrome c family protein
LAVAAIGGVSVAQPQPQPQVGQGPPPAADAAPAPAPATAPAAPVAAPVAAPAAGSIDKGRDIFANYGCGTCHTLNDAGATGHVGPAFDGNSNLSQDFIVDRVTNGQGMMPSFAGQLSADEINSVAAYIMKTKAN